MAGEKRWLPIICAMLCAMLVSPRAKAEINGFVGGDARFEDNLFRQAPNFDRPELSRSDRVLSVNGGADLDSSLAGYDISAIGQAGYDKFVRNGFLDSFHYQLTGKIKRVSDTPLGGNLSFTSRRSLSSFSTLNSPVRNIQEYNGLNGTITRPMSVSLGWIATPEYSISKNTAAILKSSNYERYGGSFGIAWNSPTGNQLSLTGGYRVSKGLDPRFVNLGGLFFDSRTNLADVLITGHLIYMISPLTSIDATLSYLKRNDRSLVNRDSNSVYGDILIDYHPRDSLTINLSAGRQPQTLDQLYVDSLRSSYVRGAMKVQVLDKVEFDVRASAIRLNYAYDPLLAVAGSALSLRETIVRAEAGAGYTISQRLTLGLQVGRETRTATTSALRYHATVVQVSLVVPFGTLGRSPLPGLL